MIEAAKIFGAIFIAIFFQILQTRQLEYFYFVDLPLVSVIYFASYKTRVESSFLGSVLGLLQDSISGVPLGMHGFTKTLIGYLVAVVNSRLILETFAAQLMLLFFMFILESALKLVLFTLANLPLPPRFINIVLIQAIATCVIGSSLLALVRVLDRKKPKE